MARSPLTLAASVSAALPGVAVVSTASLSSGEGGRYDSAVVTIDDGRLIVVRAPVDDAAAAELAAEVLALRALTPGARALLPFRAPELLGEAGLAGARTVVTDLLPGYRVEGAHIPAGRGAAVSIGVALAGLHALPASVVRAEGLPVRAPEEVRAAVRTLIDRTEATRRLPVALSTRWQSAVRDDSLWRFESTVVLGEVTSNTFLFEEPGEVPTVTGILGWQNLAVGDPAVDLHWLAGAPQAAEDIFAAYADAADRVPDPNIRSRARLYAELEFAKWLLHGHDHHREDIVADAVALLDALVDGLGDDTRLITPVASADALDEALALTLIDEALIARAGGDESLTSMQTDAYDPDMLSLFAAKAREHAGSASEDGDGLAETDAASTPGTSVAGAADSVDTPVDEPVDHDATAPIEPIDIAAWSQTRQESAGAGDSAAATETESASSATDSDEDDDPAGDAERASRAAFQRWSRSASES